MEEIFKGKSENLKLAKGTRTQAIRVHVLLKFKCCKIIKAVPTWKMYKSHMPLAAHREHHSRWSSQGTPLLTSEAHFLQLWAQFTCMKAALNTDSQWPANWVRKCCFCWQPPAAHLAPLDKSNPTADRRTLRPNRFHWFLRSMCRCRHRWTMAAERLFGFGVLAGLKAFWEWWEEWELQLCSGQL